MKDAKLIELRANGIDFVAYEQGSGPLLLCLHGFPDHARSFRHQIGPFAEAGYRVVAPYMRGYAPTGPAPDGNYQSAALARDIVGLIEALGADKAYVFGHDWGAIGAYGAALHAPQRIEKLITAAVPYGLAFLSAFLINYRQLRRSWYIFFFQSPQAEAAVSAGDFEFIRNLWVDWSPGWQFPADELEALRATFRKPGVLEAALGYYRCMFNPALQKAELAAEQGAHHMLPIAVSTLYLHGKDDGCLGVEMLDGMAAMFPAGLRSLVVDGAGHFVHQEKPEVVNRAVLDFLRG
jgi:pimeloyl-ACP methyl ester carboxylesterase